MPQEDEDWTWYACPCCDREFAYSKTRCQHILDDHLKRTEYPTNNYVICWCGKWVPLETEGALLHQHWHQQGGVLAHYIAWQLGID